MSARLIVAIISSLFEEALLVIIVLWVLPEFGIIIPLGALIAVVVLMAANSVTFYFIGSRALGQRVLLGLPSMTGTSGKVTTRICPKGTVRIKAELWQAEAVDGEIAVGTPVIVVAQDGLRLRVRPETEQDSAK